MTEKIVIKLEDIDVREFYGAKNININHIKEKNSDLSITVRGENITVKGDKRELDLFALRINRLVDYVKKYGHISETVINQSFDATHHEEKRNAKSEDAKSEGEDDASNTPGFILYGKNGMPIKARGANQQRMISELKSNDLMFAVGPAGSGKTYVAIALAVKALKAREVKRIILTRPAVEAGEKLGYLPGDMKEKLDPYLQPLYDALDDMIPQKKLESLIEEKVIQIAPLAYMRGRTLDNAFVILDEAQNTTESQLKMFLTRMGRNAKFIVTGDASQIDLPSKALSGLKEVMGFVGQIKGVSVVQMAKGDIVRHKLVKDIVDAFDRHANEVKR